MAAPFPIGIWHDTVGETLRVLLFPYTAMETVLNDTTDTFVTYAVASINSYGFSLAPSGAGSLLMVGNMPAWVAVGTYWGRVFVETAGVITQSSRLVYEGPVAWGDGVFSPVSTVGVTMTFSATGNESEIQFLSYWAGAGFPIRLVANPPQAIDVSLCVLRIGIPGAFTTFLPGAGRLVAEDAATGILLAYPTLAETAGLPREGCLIQLWRTGTGAANTGPMGHGVLKVRETLR